MITENYSLLGRNTFGVDVSARYFFEYKTVEALQSFLQSPLARTNKLLHIGGGSNLLFLSDFDGVILHSCIKGIEKKTEDDTFVYLRVGAGEVWDDFVLYCVEHGLGGVENLSLIPGEVGASPVQNIGAYGVEVKDVVFEVETIEIATSAKRTFVASECCFGYRDSVFKQHLKGKFVVTHVVFRLRKEPVFSVDYQSLRNEVERLGDLSLSTIREAVIRIRKGKLPDPKEIGSAGSFFMNPVIDEQQAYALKKMYPAMPTHTAKNGVKIPAGWLIEQCGWKGYSDGNVGVYEKQALVLINKGGGTGQKVAALARKIQSSVFEKFHIEIKSEVVFV